MKCLSVFNAVRLSIVTCFAANLMYGAAGDLDTTFGEGGKVHMGFGGGYAVAYASAVQSDGRLILAGYGNGRYSSAFGYASGGDFLLARFTTNNVLDPTFGRQGGTVLTQVSTNYPRSDSSVIRAVRIQSDGKIVVGGYSFQNSNYAGFTLVRYNIDGSVDTTFGTNGNGIVYTDFGQHSQVNALVIHAGTSNILAAGFVSTDGYNAAGVALARYKLDGTLDTTFGSGGKVTTPGLSYSANSVMIQPDGKITAAGAGIPAGSSGPAFAVFRYTSTGQPDTATFGAGTGRVITRISSRTYDYSGVANAIGLQAGDNTVQNPDKIVIAGTYREHGSPQGYFQTLIRYHLDGSLDSTFGTAGVVTNAIIPQHPFGQHCIGLSIQGFLAQPRRFTIGGFGTDGTNRIFSIARFNAAGALDTTFGSNSSGKTLLTIGRNSDQGAEAHAMVVQSGRFVLAGNRDFTFSRSDFAAARFLSSGLVDTSFGSNGVVTADISDAPGGFARAVAIQPDGKIVAAGVTPAFYNWPSNRTEQRFALARFNEDGSPDVSFGSAGKVTTAIGLNDQALTVAVQPDGKIVAGGQSYVSDVTQFGLARFNHDGSPDLTFGVGGKTSIPVGTDDANLTALRIQADGKLVAAGFAMQSGNIHFALARFLTNGTLDSAFGSGGKIITPIGTTDYAFGLGIYPDGKIVAAGLSARVDGSSVAADFAAARYNLNGSLDFSFGSLGRTTANAGGGSWNTAYGLAIQPDGKLVVAGTAGLGGIPGPIGFGSDVNAFLALARFNTNGALDTSFGSGGTVITQVGAYSDFATSVGLQSDGKIVVAGGTHNGNYKSFALRYTTNGLVDTSYGTGGTSLVDFGSATNELAYALALDSSGRAILACDGGGWFSLARLQGDSIAVGPALKISLTTTNTAIISWPYPATGWILSQRTTLGAGSWSAVTEQVNNDGSTQFIITDVGSGSGTRFFQLVKP